ncbi:MAG: HAMP domain-containing histidine kinase [Firmicutes bacterium]|nr:HAMP domain-containing histidine kinase [Bacillota bacterium]MCL2256213.1 HAMP domain-containing histidine kinase [Bacillota bacterium]
MKHRIVVILIILAIFVVSGILIWDAVDGRNFSPDIVEINRIRVSIENTENFDNLGANFEYDFTVISNEGSVLFSTKNTEKMLLEQRLNNAISNSDVVIAFSDGYIIIYLGHFRERNKSLRIALIASLSVLLIALTLGYYAYMRHFLYRPFKKLKNFAGEIATGNLDTLLPMDKDNLFGEFSASFDIMREELKMARQRLIDEEKSKKELIATLSHDIKTPIAIVRVASELLEMGEKDEKKLSNIKAIKGKTHEIDILLTDLFSSALEDLTELKINITDISSKEIQDSILGVDSLNKVSLENEAPDCLMKGDTLRLSQVFGNIISNSYKYSNSEIIVSFVLEEKFLTISIKDNGNSLKKEEVSLLTQKFYRGENAQGKHGAGLGLYISSKLIKKMGGHLKITQEPDGLKVEIKLALS